ncbi:MAG: COG1361 S-layer family protein [Candidatus Woesearchaeota archaeon]
MKKYLFVLCMILFLCSAVADLPSSADVEVRGSLDWDTITESTTLVNQDPDPAEPGGYVEVRFKVENIGTEDASDLVFEVVPEFPFSLDPGQSSRVRLGDIYARQVGEDAYVVYYRLRVDKNAVEGNNELRVRYSLDNGMQWRELNNLIVRVRTHDAILSVESVTTVPEKVCPGGDVTLGIDLKNLADSLIKDIKVKLVLMKLLQTATSVSYQELPFSPTGSTNEKTWPMLDSGETANLQFRLLADPDTKAAIYKLPLLVSYSDQLGTNYTKELITSIKICEDPDYVFGIDSSTLYKVDSKGTVNVKFVNKGRTDLKFIYLQLAESDNYDIMSSKDIYLGNIDSDDYETAQFDLYLKKEKNGNVVLPFTLEYRDAHNEKFSKQVDLELVLYSESQAEELGLKESNSTVGIVITVVIVIVGLGVYMFFRRKKKK